RGRQAAGVLVVRENGGYGGSTDRYLDLRVDDDPEPIQKLKRLVEMHHLFFGETRLDDLAPLAPLAGEIQEILMRTGYYQGPLNQQFDDPTRAALIALVNNENLEERWNGEGDQIDRLVIAYLREKFSK
ncbi:MAG: putative peptidoglycan binding domain-containing protein, partial [Omnitrophica WOR_2 bacterium]